MPSLKDIRYQLKHKLGNKQYSTGVLEILKQKNIVNRNGKPYPKKYIRWVFQGVTPNKEVELAIMEYYQKILKEEEHLKNISVEFEEIIANKAI